MGNQCGPQAIKVWPLVSRPGAGEHRAKQGTFVLPEKGVALGVQDSLLPFEEQYILVWLNKYTVSETIY